MDLVQLDILAFEQVDQQFVCVQTVDARVDAHVAASQHDCALDIWVVSVELGQVIDHVFGQKLVVFN